MELRVSQVSHTFPGKPPRLALDQLDFHVPSGQFVSIIGPSGCGKSTLLRLAANLLQPTRGQICLNGNTTPAEGVAAQQVAWMAQSPALLPWLTARKNVALAQRFQPAGAQPIPVEQVLERVGLGDYADAYPFMLSGGMQQRLALARLLSRRASLWLMDEPFASLDELTRERLTMELLDLWTPLKATVIWVTHNIHEAIRLSDRVLVISAQPGRLVADVSIEMDRPRQESSAQFQAYLQHLRACLANGVAKD